MLTETHINIDIFKVTHAELESFLEHVMKFGSRPAIFNDTFKVESVYFAGQGLCIDLQNRHSKSHKNVITISHQNQSFGFFTGGTRRLLSIPAMRSLERLMDRIKINHEKSICTFHIS